MSTVKSIQEGIGAKTRQINRGVEELQGDIRKKASEIESGIREQENRNKAYKKTFDPAVKEQERKNAAFVNEFYYGKAPPKVTLPPEVKPVIPKKPKVTPKEEKK